jgi:C1A family cysteine protease
MFAKIIIFSSLFSIIKSTLVEENRNAWKQFTHFQERFNKFYSNLEELETRFDIFKTNLKTILNHNMDNIKQNFTMGINQFTDLTPEEFKTQYASGYKPLESFGCTPFTSHSDNLPASVDWTTTGKVNPIRDQGQCGSCWAFAATANAETAWAIATNQLLDLSEQYLVDCATGIGYFNMGCNGGQPDSALKYMINDGQCSETSYPYTQKQGTCNPCAQKAKVEFSGCFDVTPNDQKALKTATAQNPVVVAIEADTRYFQSYSGGILTDGLKCGTKLDHAVEIVGYGRENGIDYWKVRNSWSSTWGEQGYFRIQRTDSVNDPGVCGIAMEPSFIFI